MGRAGIGFHQASCANQNVSFRFTRKSKTDILIHMYNRVLDVAAMPSESCFLWGARQTGKSTLLRATYPKALYFDLLLSDLYRSLLAQPSVLRQEVLAYTVRTSETAPVVVVDEVQKVPDLLDEVHWLIENTPARFVLCGSSARKLRRGHANLLGGRANRYELLPLSYREIPAFDLDRALTAGLLPRHYNSENPRRLLQAYVADYLREEVAAEALTRNVPAFSRFLDTVGLTNGAIVNYQAVASDCGVSAPTVREYYQILQDTLVGFEVPAFRKTEKRRVVAAPKWYLFDVGVAGFLGKRGAVLPGSTEYGKAFEHFMIMEMRAHSLYSGLSYPLRYWRTGSGFKVDAVLGEGEVIVEVKSTDTITYRDLKGIRAFREEANARHAVLACMVSAPRRTEDGIEILPWREFLSRLNAGEYVR